MSTRLPIHNPKQNESGSLAHKAYIQIRNRILQGHYGMGDVLSRRRLAQELNMSFLPITAGLQRLEAEGLVESKPRIGTRVRVPTQQDILDSYILREALETQAARLCCESMNKTERDALTRNARRLDSLFATSTTEQGDSQFLFSVHTYHMQFHMSIARLSGSSGLLQAIEREQVLIFNWIYDIAGRQRTLPTHFHLKLAKAVCSNDVNRADAAMREHVRHGRENIIESLGNLEISKGWRLRRKAS